MRAGKGSCNGTFGELVQGVLNEQPFLITFPIKSLKSTANFIPSQTDARITSSSSYVKAIAACNRLFQHFGIKGGGHLHIQSNIPVGKGMASSSADIVAAIRAAAYSYSLSLQEELISCIASEIEPTDGVMYEEVVAYNYIQGQLIENFGQLPPYILLGIDLGGTVDTIQFNRIAKQYDEHDVQQFQEAYTLVKMGIRQQKLIFICHAATMSARINQKILPFPCFHELERLASMYQGGVVVAHSGTVIGILLDPVLVNASVLQLIEQQLIAIFDKEIIVKTLSFT